MAAPLVASAKAGGNDGATTSGIDTTGSKFLTVLYTGGGGDGVVISDSFSNTWFSLTNIVGADQRLQIFYAIPPANKVGVAHTFTFARASSFGTIVAAGFSGVVNPADPYDGVENGASNVLSTTIQAGSITPNTTGDLLIAGMSHILSTYSSIDNSFILVQDNENGGSFYDGAMAYLVYNSTSAINPTWTLSSAASVSTIAVIGAFKTASSFKPPWWNYSAPMMGALAGASNV